MSVHVKPKCPLGNWSGEIHYLDSVARADEWRVFKRTTFVTTIILQSQLTDEYQHEVAISLSS